MFSTKLLILFMVISLSGANIGQINNEQTCERDRCLQERSEILTDTLNKLAIINADIDGSYCRSLWDEELKVVKDGSADDFHSIVSGYLNATWMVYTYVDPENPDEGLWSPRGWRLLLDRYPERNGGFGMHSLAFQVWEDFVSNIPSYNWNRYHLYR